MRVLFHGLRLLVEGDALAVAAATELLGGLPRDLREGEPDLLVRLQPGQPRTPPGGERRFYQGIIDCHAEEEGLVVTDGASQAHVRPGGGLIEVHLADESLRDGHIFAQVFLLISLVLALRWRGLFHVHSGALVAPDGRAILIAGSAGAGKSTLTLALLEAGCAYLGDDAVFLSGREGEPAVLALPRPFHVAPRTAAAFPRLAALLSGLLPSGEKRRLDPRRAWPGQERSSMGAPSLLLFPRVSAGPGTIAMRLASAEALGALIESSALAIVDGLPNPSEHLAVLREVADGARAWRVDLGLDLLAAPAETARRMLELD